MEFQCKTHVNLRKTYAWMCRLIMVTQGMMEVHAVQFWHGIVNKEFKHWVWDVMLFQPTQPTLLSVV